MFTSVGVNKIRLTGGEVGSLYIDSSIAIIEKGYNRNHSGY